MDLRAGLGKTRRSFFGRIRTLFREERLSEDTWDDLEMLLIQADVGVKTTTELVQALRDEVDRSGAGLPASQVARHP